MSNRSFRFIVSCIDGDYQLCYYKEKHPDIELQYREMSSSLDSFYHLPVSSIVSSVDCIDGELCYTFRRVFSLTKDAVNFFLQAGALDDFVDYAALLAWCIESSDSGKLLQLSQVLPSLKELIKDRLEIDTLTDLVDHRLFSIWFDRKQLEYRQSKFGL